MKQKRLRIQLAIWTVVFLAICILGGVVYYRTPVVGECSSLSQLPVFGSGLTSRNLGQIQYLALRNQRKVVARLESDSQVFERLAGELNLSIVRYQTGFDSNTPDLMAVDKKFRPSGTKVFCGYGALVKKQRTTIRLYFVPSGSDEATGVLYIHIS